jgi:hypothetical protein
LDDARKIGVKKHLIGGLGIGTTIGIFFATYSLAMWYGGRLVVTGVRTTTIIIYSSSSNLCNIF